MIALPTGCKRRAQGVVGARHTPDVQITKTVSGVARRENTVENIGELPEPPEPPGGRWCWRPMRTVELRAVDPEGHVVAVDHGAVIDETTGERTVLGREIDCPVRGRWAVEFESDGAAWLLVDGRFYVRAHAGWNFAVTPMCSDIAGSPWARRPQGGWTFIVHTWPGSSPTLMHTRDEAGAMGWYATTGLDETLTSAVVEPDLSMVTLVNGGRLIAVDHARVVAGEVLSAQEERFTSLTRTVSGIVAARDASPTERTIVRAQNARGEWTRVTGPRPPGGSTLAVWDVDIARTVAITDNGVELSLDRGRSWERVVELDPATVGGARVFSRASIGRLPGRHLAVATPFGLATDDCVHAR